MARKKRRVKRKKIRYKGKLVYPNSLTREELGDYIMHAKPSHKGFNIAVKTYLRKSKKRRKRR
ncbi:MAG: hypothetical protein ACTSUF_05385 [Candidatus Heimdallarchaeaceae archaeon]